MPRKKKEQMSAAQILEKIRQAGISNNNIIKPQNCNKDEIDNLSNRVDRLLGIINADKRDKTNMLFFVMYDIESNKVRRLVAKYLLRQGCYRVQRSIFLADMPHDKCEQIKSDLVEVQSAYENEDSIMVVPISTDLIRSMKVIGHALDVDVIMRTQNTLFF